MVEAIWDSYANWAELAKEADFDKIKRTLKGRVWKPNDVSPKLADFLAGYVAQKQQNGTKDICVVDFGCGLGRNAPLLRQFFPRVIAVDIPEMVERLKSLHGDKLPELYDGVYSSFAQAAQANPVHVLYESIVLQHIVDTAYLTKLARSFLDCQTLDTVVSSAYRSSVSPVIDWFLGDHGFELIHTEIDRTSYVNYHTVRVIQRAI